MYQGYRTRSAWSSVQAAAHATRQLSVDNRQRIAYVFQVIKSFSSKALAELFERGRTARIDAKLHRRVAVRLDALNEALSLDELNLPGYNFHALKGFRPTRYTIHVNGPWCITFEFIGGDALRVDFEQYH